MRDAVSADPAHPSEIGPFNSEVQRLGLLSYARIFFI
jgi:hypothetical protein